MVSNQPPIIAHENGILITGINHTPGSGFNAVDMTPFLVGTDTKIVIVEIRTGSSGIQFAGVRHVDHNLTFGTIVDGKDLNDSAPWFRRTFDPNEVESQALCLISGSIEVQLNDVSQDLYLVAELGGDGVVSHGEYQNVGGIDEQFIPVDRTPFYGADAGNVSHAIVVNMGDASGGTVFEAVVYKENIPEMVSTTRDFNKTWKRWNLVSVNDTDRYIVYREDSNQKESEVSWNSANFELGYIRNGYWGSDEVSSHGYQVVYNLTGDTTTGLPNLTRDEVATFSAFDHAGRLATVLHVTHDNDRFAVSNEISYVRAVGSTDPMLELRDDHDSHKMVALNDVQEFEYQLTSGLLFGRLQILSYMERAPRHGIRLKGQTLRLAGETVRIR